eukprot:gene2091-1525_t
MKGLENPGSLCYLLSLMQQYQSLPPVRALFLELDEDEEEWITNEALGDMLLSTRKAMKCEKRRTDDDKTRKLFTKRKRLVDFVLHFQRIIAHCAASDSSDDDSSTSNNSSNSSEASGDSESSSHSGGGDSDEDSDADDVSIVPLYTVMQKLTNDKVKLDKPRDCADFFSKVCKLFVTIAQDKLFQTQCGELVALAKAFLAVFQGFVQHRIHPIEWPHATEDPSIVQTDPFYYLSIDISPGDLLLSLERYSQPSAPFPFSWTEPNGQRSTLLSTKCDQLIRKREAVVPISSSSAGAASTTTGAAAAAAASTEPPGTREAIPSVLALHLRRFAIDLDAQWKEKLLDYFSFPYRLDWAPFLAPADHAADEPPPPLWYQLHASTGANGHEPIDVAEWLRPWFGGNDEEGDAAAAAQPTTIDGHETAPERRHDAVDVNDDASSSSSSSSSTTVSALDDAVAMMLFYVRLPAAPPTDVAATT